MKYTVLIERYAQKQIMKLDKKLIPGIKTAIADLANNPRPFGYKKLKGEDAYRIRIGDYRVIYEIEDDIILVTVVSVGHRKDVYKS
jgi:mRNA interferase RelE/StbE